jgi:hypothetical protein
MVGMLRANTEAMFASLHLPAPRKHPQRKAGPVAAVPANPSLFSRILPCVRLMVIESFLQDLRVGLRMLARRPAFSLMAASSLALGIGLVATQFSLIDGILLRGLPISEAQRLMHVSRADPQRSDPSSWQSGSLPRLPRAAGEADRLRGACRH